jgi:hydrogenase/urease accessory protein HupE
MPRSSTFSRALAAAAVTLVVASGSAVQAHPAPFSYIDVRLAPVDLSLTVVAHVYDIAHDLGIAPVERVLDPATLQGRGAEMAALLRGRLSVSADGRALAAGDWSSPEPLPDRQSVRFRVRYQGAAPAVVRVTTTMFPYDPVHQTFVNFYEGEVLGSQAILDRQRSQAEYFAGTRQGVLAVIQRFVPSGIHHILIGPDHLLFLVGLLLIGGSLRRIAMVVTAFTLAHSVTLSLAALNLLSPPAHVVEPAIALSIVYVGADNLLMRGGRDMRAWIAFAFGLIHGFGFANVLRDMELPRRALGWSLFSFNIGVEIGQLLVVALVTAALAMLRARSESAGRRLAFAGSVIVIVAGAYWFVQRVFFSGGMA